MDQTELLRRLVTVLARLEIPYLITGSVATIFWGEPRLTLDIDVVVELPLRAVQPLLDAFAPPAYYASDEAAEQAVRHRRQFNIIHSASGLKIDFMVAAMDDFDRSRFARRRRADLGGFEADLAAPEDAIVKKLVYFRAGGSEKHLRDIAGVLRITGDAVDHDYISSWAERLDVVDVWQLVVDRLSLPRG